MQAIDRTGPLGEMLGTLLGCEWGRRIAHPEDTTPCDQRAERYVILHDGPRETSVKLCGRHVELVMAETTPRQDETGGSE